MFLITYKKRNGELIYRERMSLPGKIGDTTSMGWLIVDIKENFRGKYYSSSECSRLAEKRSKFVKRYRKLKDFMKNDLWKYSLFVLYIPLITLYLIK